MMSTTPGLIAAAARSCCELTKTRSTYALAYGSHAAGRAGPNSDLDLVLVTDARPGFQKIQALVAAVDKLHREHGLTVDTEVDYEAKLVADRVDVEAAVSLDCFERAGPAIIPEPVRLDPAWLNSRHFARRLLLNALTTEHVFLGGNAARYQRDCRRAAAAVARLALAIRAPATETTLADAVDTLVRAPDGAAGKDWLGYQPTSHLCSTVQYGMTTLATCGSVRVIDGHRYRLSPHRSARSELTGGT